MQRNRSEGWKYAKISGHKNEKLVCDLFNDAEFCVQFEQELGISSIESVEVGGIHERSVSSVLGGLTKSKGDLFIKAQKGEQLSISIKKSIGGQVYLISLDHFLSGLNKLFNVKVDGETKRALELFFGSVEGDEIKKISNLHFNQGIITSAIYNYQIRKNRLTVSSLVALNPLYEEIILNWFKNNIGKITRFCFSSGLVKDKSLWANYIWYVNQLGEHKMNDIISIDDLVTKVEKNKNMINFGQRNGGTTIILPFGFVQWHQKYLQFHHNFNNIVSLF